MKKPKIILLSTIIVAIGIAVCCVITNSISTSAVKKLAAFGEEQFLTVDFQHYIDTLRSQGLSDLTAEISTSYSYEYDYDKSTKTLHLSCHLDRIISDKIDNYYTTEYNGSNGSKLAKIMESMKSVYAFERRYTTDSRETVIVNIEKPDHYVTIYTSSGREYEYVFGFIDSVRVEIDGDWVYSADVTEVLPERPRGTHMPYIGMPESEIDITCLGKPTTKEKCKDFYSLKASHRWTEYRWYEGDIQDLKHLKCIVKIWYYDHETKREVPGYACDVIIYD